MLRLLRYLFNLIAEALIEFARYAKPYDCMHPIHYYISISVDCYLHHGFAWYNVILMFLFVELGDKYLYEYRKNLPYPLSKYHFFDKKDFFLKIVPVTLSTWHPIGLERVYLNVAETMHFKEMPFLSVNILCIHTVILLFAIPIEVFYVTCPDAGEKLDTFCEKVWSLVKLICWNVFAVPFWVWPSRLLRVLLYLLGLKKKLDDTDYHFSLKFLFFCFVLLLMWLQYPDEFLFFKESAHRVFIELLRVIAEEILMGYLLPMRVLDPENIVFRHKMVSVFQDFFEKHKP